MRRVRVMEEVEDVCLVQRDVHVARQERGAVLPEHSAANPIRWVNTGDQRVTYSIHFTSSTI